ncbi:hypothetical protein PSQ40_17800 [Curvibacter sp. HBC61]|uniref:Uncharacterized protein n=1 Tax=Curvibacter cyanobacteriorum TaxID=3026422 RepID=A0ABT5N4G2_9BURK|nr:hypothetical protein [Curvibacter sp. HBC61]MDD0840444.1 hypothetical protein [Curvibacter sp. HBC61]
MGEPFADLLFQDLRKIELIDPWRVAGHPVGVTGSSLLAGAMALHFGDLAVICSSPLRYAHTEQGTAIAAWSSAGMLSLGYRVSVVRTEDAGLVLPAGSCGLTVSAKDLRLRGLLGPELPLMLLQRLTEDGGVGAIQLRVGGAEWFQLLYRRDLDGAIEFSPVGARHHIEAITVDSPADELGWLHPASAYPFVMDGQYWRTAHPKDWPWPLAREWRSQPASCQYRQVMKTALLARFAQHENLNRRLLALRCPVAVADVPVCLLEEVAASALVFQTEYRARMMCSTLYKT